MKKQRGVYTKFRYQKELLFYYVKSTPSFLTAIFLLCLVVILFLTLKWGKDSNIQPIGVIILLQIAYATLASVLFYLITFLWPLQAKKLKYSLFIQNSSAHIHISISDLFRSIATKEETDNLSGEFYNQANLKRLAEAVDGTKPLRIINTVIIFPNPYEATLHIVKAIEEKADRLLGLSDILSIETMETLSTLLSVSLNLKMTCQFSRQKDFKFVSLQLCELYMLTDVLSRQVRTDFSFRYLYHYNNIRNRESPESKDFHNVFWSKKPGT